MSHPKEISTRITRLFQCRYPIVLPGMSWISTPSLTAAVSDAGGLGILASGPLNADETRKAIHQIRQLTDQPFGIGVTIAMPGALENARVALEEKVPILNTSLGKVPQWMLKELENYDGKLLCTVTNKKHAEVAIENGAHALMATGHEAAAHGGDLTTMSLIGQLQQYDIPLVAAGGIVNGKGLASALTVGADAVAMGTRLALTQESPLGSKGNLQEYKGTIYGSNFDGIPARVLDTPKARELMKKRPGMLKVAYRALLASRKLNIPLYQVLGGLVTNYDKIFMVAQLGAATEAIVQATVDGNLDDGVQFIGQGIDNIPPGHQPAVADLISGMIQEAEEASAQTHDLFQPVEHDFARTAAMR